MYRIKQDTKAKNMLLAAAISFCLATMISCVVPPRQATDKLHPQKQVTSSVPNVPANTRSDASAAVNKDRDKHNVALISSASVIVLYTLLLIAVCVYYKKTGVRAKTAESWLSALATRLGPKGRIISIIAGLIGRIYCDKQKK